MGSTCTKTFRGVLLQKGTKKWGSSSMRLECQDRVFTYNFALFYLFIFREKYRRAYLPMRVTKTREKVVGGRG